MDGVSMGGFSRRLTHAHLFSSCYQPLFRSKVICTHDPSCSSAPNSRATAVKRALFILSLETKGLVYLLLPPPNFSLSEFFCVISIRNVKSFCRFRSKTLSVRAENSVLVRKQIICTFLLTLLRSEKRI